MLNWVVKGGIRAGLREEKLEQEREEGKDGGH
jgi:hypothetical protein